MNEIKTIRIENVDNWQQFSSEQFTELIQEHSKLKQEKQGLIKYLEDKINSINNGVYRTDLTTSMVIKAVNDTYQEILSKIKEGNYE